MKFLYTMLSVVWLIYGWVCYQAMQWEPPYPIPWHAARDLQKTNPTKLQKDMETYRLYLNMEDLTTFQRTNTLFNLAICHWLTAYLQDSRQKQVAYLKMSLKECRDALAIVPDSAHFTYCIADLYHQMQEYEKAEHYYIEAISAAPDESLYRQRYHEMLDERAEKRAEENLPDATSATP